MDFSSIKDRARKMIHEDAKKDARIIKERVADRNNSKFFAGQPNDMYSQVTTMTESVSSAPSEAYYDDSDSRLNEAIDARMAQLSSNIRTSNSEMPPTSMPARVNKNLPKEILESFSENYIDESALSPFAQSMAPISDGIGDKPSKKPIREDLGPSQVQSRVSPVDYELIKSIVESSVKKYAGAFAKKILNESKGSSDDTVKAVQFTGDKFMFVTKGGDVYEANMVFKKNIGKK